MFRVLLWLYFITFVNVVAAAPTLVKVRALADVLIEKKYTSPATAVAINRSQISAEISARIVRIEVQVGDVVKAGEALVKLDCRSYENALSRSEAALESLQAQVQLAQQQLRRAQTLQTAGNLSEDIRDQRVADFDIARANLKGQVALVSDARLLTERCSITAPYRATITARLAGEGTLATPGLPLLEIAGLEAVELVAQIPVDLIESVKRSKSLVFVTQNKLLDVSIRNYASVINAATGNREIRLRTPGALVPGSSGRLEWYSQPLLPASLLTRRDGVLGVFIVRPAGDKNLAQFVPVEDALEGRPAPVTLPVTTQIIVEGRHNLAPNDEISMVTDF